METVSLKPIPKLTRSRSTPRSGRLATVQGRTHSQDLLT